MKRNGFTLIEVMISLAIFTIIAFATVSQVEQINNTKETALSQLEQYDGLRATISILRQDLTQVFHILYDDLGADNKALLMKGEPIPHSIFDGRKNQLVFTALSHRVYYAGLKECEQTEISYFLQENPDPDVGGNVLMKRESGMIDENLYEGGTIYRILEHVSKLEFQYWDIRKQKWVDDWNSDGRDFRDRFPLAVKMVLGVATPGKPPMELETSFKIAFPNNEKFIAKF